jgi:hypothetical protein
MPTIVGLEHTQTARSAPISVRVEERLHMSDIRHGDTVTSKFFKGTRAHEEEFRLRIREQELEKV